jgi:hypothetical protein
MKDSFYSLSEEMLLERLAELDKKIAAKDLICSQCGRVQSDFAGWLDRLVDIDKRIAAVKQWGALLTALNEERQGILREMGL